MSGITKVEVSTLGHYRVLKQMLALKVLAESGRKNKTKQICHVQKSIDSSLEKIKKIKENIVTTKGVEFSDEQKKVITDFFGAEQLNKMLTQSNVEMIKREREQIARFKGKLSTLVYEQRIQKKEAAYWVNQLKIMRKLPKI